LHPQFGLGATLTDNEMTTLRLVSATFSGRDRIEEFRETYGRALMKLDIEPLPGHPLDFDFTVRGFPGFGIAKGRLSPTHNTHTAAMIEDDDLILVHTPQGLGSLRQIGREVTLQSGDATLISNGSTGTFLGHVPSQLCNLRLNRAMLSPLASDVDAALCRPISRDNPALRLMMRYAAVMDDVDALAAPELRRSVALHMHDLAALLLGATPDGAEAAKKRGVRAARLRAIKDDIVENLARRNLSASTVATRHGVTARYVNMLFEVEGRSFSEFVLAQRLARAHRMLVDQRLIGRPISAIAYDVGFGDLSYFNRTFRRTYAMTPSDVRRASLDD
jgi:AraC-like DNA-binding protein